MLVEVAWQHLSSRDSVCFGYLHIAIIIKRIRFWFHGLPDVATFQKSRASVQGGRGCTMGDIYGTLIYI